MEVVQNVGIIAGAIVAAGTAVRLLFLRLDEMGRWLDNVNAVVMRELTHNAGTSMKDQLTAVKAEQDRLRQAIEEHVSDIEVHAADPTAHLRPSSPDAGRAGPR